MLKMEAKASRNMIYLIPKRGNSISLHGVCLPKCSMKSYQFKHTGMGLTVLNACPVVMWAVWWKSENFALYCEPQIFHSDNWVGERQHHLCGVVNENTISCHWHSISSITVLWLSICVCPVAVKINLWCLKCMMRCVNNSQLLVCLTLNMCVPYVCMCLCVRACLCVSLAGKCCDSYCQTCAGGWRSTALTASDLMVLPLCCTITMASVRLFASHISGLVSVCKACHPPLLWNWQCSVHHRVQKIKE